MSEFKVGDRVGHSEAEKKDWFALYNPEGLGTVVAITTYSASQDPFTYIYVDWDGENSSYYPHYENELVPANMG